MKHSKTSVIWKVSLPSCRGRFITWNFKEINKQHKCLGCQMWGEQAISGGPIKTAGMTTALYAEQGWISLSKLLFTFDQPSESYPNKIESIYFYPCATLCLEPCSEIWNQNNPLCGRTDMSSLFPLNKAWLWTTDLLSGVVTVDEFETVIWSFKMLMWHQKMSQHCRVVPYPRVAQLDCSLLTKSNTL